MNNPTSITSKKLPQVLALAAFFITPTAFLDASVIVVTPSLTTGTVLLRDTDLDGDADSTNFNGTPGVGAYSGTANVASAGFSFVLPTIPVGESITSVQFTAYHAGTNLGTLVFNVDVYGVRSNASGSWQTSDYGIGATQPGTLLQNDWTLGVGTYLAPIDATSFVSTGYTPGNTIFLRAAPDADTASVAAQSNMRVFFEGPAATNPPTLTITTAVPEPATYGAIFGAAVMLLTFLRRRRNS